MANGWPASVLPADLRAPGYTANEIGEGERILPHAIAELIAARGGRGMGSSNSLNQALSGIRQARRGGRHAGQGKVRKIHPSAAKLSFHSTGIGAATSSQACLLSLFGLSELSVWVTQSGTGLGFLSGAVSLNLISAACALTLQHSASSWALLN
jgi:hypothetical protein